MSTPAHDKQRLLARNAALRAELAAELAAVRAEIAPAVQWVDQAQRVATWAREHAALIAGAAGLLGTLLLRRGSAKAPARGPSPLRRLWRLVRLAITVGGFAARFTRPGTPRAPSGR